MKEVLKASHRSQPCSCTSLPKLCHTNPTQTLWFFTRNHFISSPPRVPKIPSLLVLFCFLNGLMTNYCLRAYLLNSFQGLIQQIIMPWWWIHCEESENKNFVNCSASWALLAQLKKVLFKLWSSFSAVPMRFLGLLQSLFSTALHYFVTGQGCALTR